MEIKGDKRQRLQHAKPETEQPLQGELFENVKEILVAGEGLEPPTRGL
jgi:hypothetical protein